MRAFFYSYNGNKSISDKPNLSDLDLNIVFDGDSLTQGINGSGIDQYYPKEVQSWLSTRVNSLEFHSFGVSGQRLYTMLANAPVKIYPLTDPLKTNVLVVWEDVNQILSGERTALQTLQDLNDYCDGARTAGYDYIIVPTGYNSRRPYLLWNTITEQYQPVNINPANETEWQSYFDIIKNQIDPVWDLSIDLRDAPIIGGGVAQDWQTVPEFKDYIHLTAEGYDIVANEVINKGILSLFNNA